MHKINMCLFLERFGFCCLLFIQLCWKSPNVSAEVFTSMADVNNLINSEGRIISILRLLVDAEKEKLAAIEE